LVKKKTPAAAGKAPSSRGPASSNRGAYALAASFVSSPTVKSARIISKRPWAFGAEFGSKRFKQFPSWSGKPSATNLPGYVGWRAVRDNTPKIRDEYGDSLMDAFKSSYPIRG
jgi:hypothetical protein